LNYAELAEHIQVTTSQIVMQIIYALMLSSLLIKCYERYVVCSFGQFGGIWHFMCSNFCGRELVPSVTGINQSTMYRVQQFNLRMTKVSEQLQLVAIVNVR